MKHNPAQRRYVRRFVLMMLGYVVLLFASNSLTDLWHVNGALLVLFAVRPALPLIGVVVVMGLYLLEEQDEFLRGQLVIAMLFGLGILPSAATIWGFLQLAHVIGSPPTFLAFPLWCAAFGGAKGVMAVIDRRAVQP